MVGLDPAIHVSLEGVIQVIPVDIHAMNGVMPTWSVLSGLLVTIWTYPPIQASSGERRGWPGQARP
jgi:hypothetical protein